LIGPIQPAGTGSVPVEAVLAAAVIFEERGIRQVKPDRSRHSFQFRIPFAIVPTHYLTLSSSNARRGRAVAIEFHKCERRRGLLLPPDVEPMRRLCLLLLLVLGTSGAMAQTISEPLRDAEIVSDAMELDAKRTGRARFFDPQDGQLDLSYFLENPRGFLPIPIVVTEPAVGYGGGVAGMFLRPRREAGDEGWARPDILGVGAFGTQNGTWGAFGGDATRWLDGRLRTLVGAATGQFNLDFYGLGTEASSLNQGVRYTLQFTGAVAQANWQLAPKSPWAVGLRYVYANVNPKPRTEAPFQASPIGSA